MLLLLLLLLVLICDYGLFFLPTEASRGRIKDLCLVQGLVRFSRAEENNLTQVDSSACTTTLWRGRAEANEVDTL